MTNVVVMENMTELTSEDSKKLNRGKNIPAYGMKNDSILVREVPVNSSEEFEFQ